MIKQVFVVRAPWIFGTIWAVVKNFVDPKTRSKVEILGRGYLGKLLEEVAVDVVGVALGVAADGRDVVSNSLPESHAHPSCTKPKTPQSTSFLPSLNNQNP